jgi:uncharacterized membrane protein YgaE (UPF0421/DUF939 family)
MVGDEIVELVCFVLRCAGAATLAYLLASAVGLPHPLWACASALIVTQDNLAATLETIVGRVLGTLIGVTVAVAIGAFASRLGLGVAAQLAIAVSICALFAWRRPEIRSCLWTSPIVLITAGPTESIVTAGFHRGSEVILGVLVAGLLHIGADRGVSWANRVRKRYDSEL